MDQYQKVKESMRNCKYPQVKAFIRKGDLDVNNMQIWVLQQQIYNVKEIYRKAEKRPKNDIQRYFKCQGIMV